MSLWATLNYFKMLGGHTSDDVSTVIACVLADILEVCVLKYFVSDSKKFKEAVVRKYMADGAGNDYKIPCAFHFCQFVMRDTVLYFIEDFEINELG